MTDFFHSPHLQLVRLALTLDCESIPVHRSSVTDFHSSMPVANGSAPLTWNVTVNDTAPIWVYVRASENYMIHCSLYIQNSAVKPPLSITVALAWSLLSTLTKPPHLLRPLQTSNPPYVTFAFNIMKWNLIRILGQGTEWYQLYCKRVIGRCFDITELYFGWCSSASRPWIQFHWRSCGFPDLGH